MKFTFTITLTGVEPEPREKLVVATHPSEVIWHIALKVLGFLLFFEERPQIEQGVGWTYKPDLVAVDSRGDVRLWVDCGNVGVRKVDRVTRRLGAPGRFFALQRDRREAENLTSAVAGRVKHPERVGIVWFDEGFVDRLAELLDVTNDLAVRRGARDLELTLRNRRGEHLLRTGVHRR